MQPVATAVSYLYNPSNPIIGVNLKTWHFDTRIMHPNCGPKMIRLDRLKKPGFEQTKSFKHCISIFIYQHNHGHTPKTAKRPSFTNKKNC